MQHILGMRPDAAQDSEHRLNEQRRAHQTALQKMGQVVEMRGVVAFKLEAGATIAQSVQDEFDVLEGVAEDQIARILQRLFLPVMLEVLETVQHGEQAEIHRPHVERGDFRLEDLRRLDAFLHRHVRRAARGQIDHRVGRLLDARQEAGKGLWRLIGFAVFRIAGMQMDDGRAGLRRAHRGVGDFFRRHRQIGRHGRGVDGAGHGAGDDDLVVHAHGGLSLAIRRLCAASAISRRSRQAWRSCSLAAGRRLRRSASIVSNTGPFQSARFCMVE